MGDKEVFKPVKFLLIWEDLSIIFCKLESDKNILFGFYP